MTGRGQEKGAEGLWQGGALLPSTALRHLFREMGQACLLTDANNRILAANPAFEALSGYAEAEMLGDNPRLFSSGRLSPEDYADLWQTLLLDGRWAGEVWNRRKDGSLYPAWLAIHRIDTEDDPPVRHYLALYSEIERQVAAAERLSYLAYHDPLTRLPNRLAYEWQLDMALKRCRREGVWLAVMLIDLDRFKVVNDTLGHPVGDGLLRSVAERLRESVRESDIVARLGGDEFVVVLTNLDGALAAGMVAGKVQQALAEFHRVGEHLLYATPSIGISIFPDDGEDAETLFRNADTAMYHAKSRGRNNYQFYEARMNEAAVERLRLENALRQAVDALCSGRHPFELHFQPQLAMPGGQTVGLEALLRWRSPEFGEVDPTLFIAIAEETGLIQPLGDWVFWESCRQARALRDAGIDGVRIAINLSAQQLRNEGLPSVVRGALACYDLEPADLELEVTESVAMQNPGAILAVLVELSAMGVVLAIDNFGTGYSSLAYLKHLPIRRLKLDRSFVRTLEVDPSDAAICSATIALGRHLGLELVASGVETAAQAEFLARLGCAVMQGYHFSRPGNIVEAMDFIRRSNSLPID